MAIQSDETLVTKGDLKNLYTDKILPYLGGNMMMSTNVSEFMSTSEKIIGVQLDGRPLYQKTLTGTMSGSYDTEKNLIPASSLPANMDPKIAQVEVGLSFVEYPGGDYGSRPAVFSYSTSHMISIQYASSTTGVTMKTTGCESRFNGGKYYITMRYTKTTDTATSALTTPGCYDITRPDLQPANKEVFFGNGAYGYRATGNVNASATDLLQTPVYIADFWSNSTHTIINQGGYVVRRHNGSRLPLMYCDPNNLMCFQLQTGNYQGTSCLLFGYRDTQVGIVDYDIWCTYTK